MMNTAIIWFEFIFKLILIFSYSTCAVLSFRRIEQKFKSIPYVLSLSFPFFLAYKLAAVLGQRAILNNIYPGLCIAGVLLFCLSVCQNVKLLREDIEEFLKLLEKHNKILLFLAGIFAFFSIKGLFLEYPSDAITYFQRVGLANQNGPAVVSSLWKYDSTNTFFSSLENWLVGSDYLMRQKLGVVAGLNVCLLCYLAYRLSLWCTQARTVAAVSAFLFLGFYGNLQISFSLYKILQGATFAMAAYMEAIPVLYRFFDGLQSLNRFSSQKIVQLIYLVLIFIVCIDCHQEKLLYFFAIIFSYLFFVPLRRLIDCKRIDRLYLIFFIFIFWGLLVVCFSDKQAAFIDWSLLTLWISVAGSSFYTYWPVEPNSAIGLLEMLAFALAFAVLINSRIDSKQFFVATIAISPVFIFVNPVVITSLIKFTSPYNLYRLLIGGMPWLFLPMACSYLQQRYRLHLGLIPIFFVLISVWAYAPSYGKIPHLIRQIPVYADGKDLSPLVETLLEKRAQRGEQPFTVLATPYVNSYLGAWPGLTVESNRWLDNNPANGPGLLSLYSPEITQSELSITFAERSFDVIILDRRQGLNYQSWLGRMTRHWPADLIVTQQSIFAGDVMKDYLDNSPDSTYEKTFDINGFEVYQPTK